MNQNAKASRYYTRLAASFVRGRLGVSGEDDEELVREGLASGLRLHKFKRTTLPRVKKVIGVLRSIRPRSLLDVGSGRGAFLWPLLDGLPHVPVTAIDMAEQRVSDINAVREGGTESVEAKLMNAQVLSFEESSFDVVTALEVLEHVECPERVCHEIVRVARRLVVVSVPSKPDDNPQHIHLFDHDGLRGMLELAGARTVDLEYVLNHMIAVAKI